MKAIKLIALALLGLILPVSLALAIYLVSASSFDAPAGAVPRVTRTLARPRPTSSPTPTASPRPTNGEDVSGPCDEAEHADDPRCSAGADDNPTPGDGDEDSDNSGPGSDNSGPGSDNSGSGSDNSGSGSDNSGPGSDSSGSGSGDSGGDD